MSSEIERFLTKYSLARINSATVVDLMNFLTYLEQLSSTTTDSNIKATIASLKKCPIGQLAGRLAYLKSYIETQSKRKSTLYSKGRKSRNK